MKFIITYSRWSVRWS